MHYKYTDPDGITCDIPLPISIAVSPSLSLPLFYLFNATQNVDLFFFCFISLSLCAPVFDRHCTRICTWNFANGMQSCWKWSDGKFRSQTECLTHQTNAWRIVFTVFHQFQFWLIERTNDSIIIDSSSIQGMSHSNNSKYRGMYRIRWFSNKFGTRYGIVWWQEHSLWCYGLREYLKNFPGLRIIG